MATVRPVDILLFFTGQRRFRIKLSDAAAVLNLCRQYGLVYRDFRQDGTAHVTFSCTESAALAVLSLCRQKNIPVEEKTHWGLPALLWHMRKRIGLLVGALLAVGLVSLSGRYLWSIHVSGNETVSYGEIVSALAEYGIQVGERIDRLDVDKTETLVMLHSEKIAWMSVNIIGTTAEVQIREAVSPPKSPPKSKNPANLVATRDGQIDHLEIFAGEAAVREGDTVRRGDVLVSGIRDSNSSGFMITRAAGSVWAETLRDFQVEIPLVYPVRRAVKSVKTEASLIFFSKEIKFFKEVIKNEGTCDTIEVIREEVFRLPDGTALPLSRREIRTVFYETEMAERTAKEAMELAYYELERKIRAEIPEAELLCKQTEGELTATSYILRCRLRCLENIAEQQDFVFEVGDASD